MFGRGSFADDQPRVTAASIAQPRQRCSNTWSDCVDEVVRTARARGWALSETVDCPTVSTFGQTSRTEDSIECNQRPQAPELHAVVRLQRLMDHRMTAAESP